MTRAIQQFYLHVTRNQARHIKELAMVSKISRVDLKARLDSGGPPLVLLEALPAQYYLPRHLPSALNMPHDAVDRLAPRLVPDKHAEIVVYCASATCRNSAIAAERLTTLGYTRVSTYHEGKEDWVAAGLATESGIEAAAE
jgi:rhodanese-related sulfurtransferase